MREDAMHAIKKLDTPQNLTQLAYDSIKSYILSADLDENTRLTEDLLSSQLGISKSPVREALNSLRTEGLIRIEARRGAYLRRFSVKEVKDLYDLREVLEVFAVRTATLTPKLSEHLHKSVRRTQKFLDAHDKVAHIEEDLRFHHLIAASTGNVELCHILDNVQNQILLYRRKTYNLSSSTAPSAHCAIVEALEQGNRDGAESAMRQHIALVRERLIDSMHET
jgi:DNA-binding GntR family transcriptional regulator